MKTLTKPGRHTTNEELPSFASFWWHQVMAFSERVCLSSLRIGHGQQCVQSTSVMVSVYSTHLHGNQSPASFSAPSASTSAQITLSPCHHWANVISLFLSVWTLFPLLTPLDGPHPSIIHLYTFLAHQKTYYSCKRQPGLLIFKILVPQYMPLLDSISARPLLRVSGRESICQFSLLAFGMFYVMSPETGG